MAEQKLTPEDKLLKIIEKSSEQGRPIAREIQRQRKKINIKRWFSSFKNTGISKLKWKAPVLSLRLANRILLITALLFTFFFIFDFIKGRMRMDERFVSISALPSDEVRRAGERPSAKADLAVSLKEAKKRNIFTLTPQATAVERNDPQKEIRDLKLVGILWSKTPQVMIEDTKDKKTYILKAGEDVSRWKVKGIYRDKAILADESGEWELR